MAQGMGAMRRFAARSLRMESLERRDLLSVTLVEGTETFKSFEFVAATALTVDGSWKVPNPIQRSVPFSGHTTSFHGTASYTGRMEGTIHVDVLTAKGTYTTLDGVGGNFTLTDGSITEGTETTGRFAGQLAGDVKITGRVNTNTALSGPMNGSFYGASRSLTLSYNHGDVRLEVRGTIAPQTADPFSVAVSNAVWTGTGIGADVTVGGGVQRVLPPETPPKTLKDRQAIYNTPVAFVKLYWASGPDFAQRIGGELKDKLPIYWNEASGKYLVDSLPMPPPTATHLLLVPQFKNAAVIPQTGTPMSLALPGTKPDLSIADAQVVEGNAGTTAIGFQVTLSAPVPFSITVPFATFNDTAIGGTAKQKADFIHRRGIVTFAPGETQKTIAIQVKGDTRIEGVETFSVRLLGGSSWATPRDLLGVGTIVNDDPAPPVLNAALLAWTAADAGSEPASYVAAGRHRESSASGLAAVHDAAFMDSVL